MEKLLTLDELAFALGRSAQTIKKDLRRNPDAVPPQLTLPGTRLLRWRERDVQASLDSQKSNSCMSGSMA